MLKQKDINRFWLKIIFPKDTINECWEYNGFLDKDGYGKFWWNNHQIGAHRFSFIIHNQNININGLIVCHKCDNPSCVNPNHLFVGTTKDNLNDRDIKNRNVKGEDINTSVVTIKKVEELIQLILNNQINNVKCAATFLGIKTQMMLKIINGHAWKKSITDLDREILCTLKQKKKGKPSYNRIFKNSDIINIRCNLQSGQSVTSIAKQYNVHYNIISDIKLNKTYNNVG